MSEVTQVYFVNVRIEGEELPYKRFLDFHTALLVSIDAAFKYPEKRFYVRPRKAINMVFDV